MSGAHDGQTAPKEKDPLLRFLAGCAIVLAAFAAIIIGGCGFFAWRLVREETPGRPMEAMLAGDESRYWCFDLRPDDEGLVAMMERLERVNAETRRRVLEGTPFKGFPFPTRRADIHKILPMKVELAMTPDEGGWAGRATMSRGTFRMRAALKVMRWAIAKDPQKSRTIDVDGVQVTVLHEVGHDVAFATVGNRVLVAGNPEMLRRILATPQGETPAALAGIPELHDSMKLPGEDGWGFAANTEVQGPGRPLRLLGAVASFDLAPDDALHVRVAVPAGDGAGLAALSAEEARSIVASFLPHVPDDAVTLDDGFPILEGGRAWRMEGRVSGLSGRFGSVFGGWPSAIPKDPSPQPTSDPRSDTPAEPPRGETPNPAH